MAKKKNTQEQSDLPDLSDTELKMPESAVYSSGKKRNSSILPIILGVLIFILLTILVGLYFWGQSLKNQATPETPTASRPTAEENNEPESTNAEADVQTFQALSPSDELNAIENDIESTNLNSLDAELNDIEAELN